MKDLKINFGGNIFDVHSKQHQITIESPAIFIGKFKQPIKTRMEISGKNITSGINLVSPLDLSNTKYIQNTTSKYLPELWNQLAYPKIEIKKNIEKNIWRGVYDFTIIYSYLFGLILLFIVFFTVKYSRKIGQNNDKLTD